MVVDNVPGRLILETSGGLEGVDGRGGKLILTGVNNAPAYIENSGGLDFVHYHSPAVGVVNDQQNDVITPTFFMDAPLRGPGRPRNPVDPNQPVPEKRPVGRPRTKPQPYSGPRRDLPEAIHPWPELQTDRSGPVHQVGMTPTWTWGATQTWMRVRLQHGGKTCLTQPNVHRYRAPSQITWLGDFRVQSWIVIV
ncbi:hypothetical protein B0H10DRAFT_1957336 [Mycena sp. CBHHK59/15]|nr:hypothetical protein B0H10DRAFT_1957336 [Mycena sp. CBHHK59/15]